MIGTLPPKLTVAYILEVDDDDGDKPITPTTTSTTTTGEQLSDLTDDQIKEWLTANGIDIGESTIEDGKKAMMKIQSCPNFWRHHSSLHPNHGRVKNWLWVHDRYRAQLQDMLQKSETDRIADFTKFYMKIDKHTEFENEQLFKFFIDHKIGNQDAFATLIAQHSDIKLLDTVKEALKDCQNDHDKAQKALEAYVGDMVAHLKLEEQTIVGPWLQLTNDQYKTYRSYLSWTYCFMY